MPLLVHNLWGLLQLVLLLFSDLVWGHHVTRRGQASNGAQSAPPPEYVSAPVRSHPLINISEVSIIDRWISPLRCTKIIQTFLCWNWNINILPAGCLVKGWKVGGVLLCFALCSHWALEMKNILCCLYPSPRDLFSFTLLFASSNRFDAFRARSFSSHLSLSSHSLFYPLPLPPPALLSSLSLILLLPFKVR